MQCLGWSVLFAVGCSLSCIDALSANGSLRSSHRSATVYIPQSNSVKVQLNSASPNRKWTVALHKFVRFTSRPVTYDVFFSSFIASLLSDKPEIFFCPKKFPEEKSSHAACTIWMDNCSVKQSVVFTNIDWKLIGCFKSLYNSRFFFNHKNVRNLYSNKMDYFHVRVERSFYRDFLLCFRKSDYWLPFQYLKLNLKYISIYLEFMHWYTSQCFANTFNPSYIFSFIIK